MLVAGLLLGVYDLQPLYLRLTIHSSMSENWRAIFDARGCALPRDADKDGVIDANDRCSNTPAGTRVDACLNAARGARADARGCAIIFEEGKKNVVLDGVAESLLNSREVNVEVAGHTDNTGSHALNVRLSGQRAESVRAYLVTKGVAANRLAARGYGPDEPTASNSTSESRLANRRVELKRTN